MPAMCVRHANTQNSIEADKSDLMATLNAMEAFARHVVQNFSGRDAELIADAIRGFLDHVKSQTEPSTGT